MTSPFQAQLQRVERVTVGGGTRVLTLEILAETATQLRGLHLEDAPPFYRVRNERGSERLYCLDKSSVTRRQWLDISLAPDMDQWVEWPKSEWFAGAHETGRRKPREPRAGPELLPPGGKRAITFGEV